MAEIIKELTLNFHPKNYKNNSLFDAQNIKISEDGSCLENDNELESVSRINDFLSGLDISYHIVHILPCNNELILFVNNTALRRTINEMFIVRYSEIGHKIAIVYGQKNILNGTNYITGISCKNYTYDKLHVSADFTYNVSGALIISFCIYLDNLSDGDVSKLFPLSTINLGTFDKGNVVNNIWVDSSDVYNDRHLPHQLLSNIPEVLLPTFTNLKYTNGKSYQGWYNIYIRYKINNYDYTQWYSVGPRFPVTNKNLNVITDLQGDITNYSPLTFKGFYGSDVDNLSTSFQFTFTGLDGRYNKYQIGFIILNKTLNKHVHTDDIDLIHSTYLFDRENLIEETIDTNVYENYYNVKNIVNKQNKLYISNYITSKDDALDVSDVKLTTQYQNIASGLYFQNNSNLYYPGTVESMGNLLPFLLEHGVDIRKLTSTIRVRFLRPLRHDDTLGDANYAAKGYVLGSSMNYLPVSDLYSTALFKETHQSANFVMDDTYTGNNPHLIDNINLYSGISTTLRPYTNPYKYKELFSGARMDVNLYTSNINVSLDNTSQSYVGSSLAEGLYKFLAQRGFVVVTINGVNNIVRPSSPTEGYSSIDLKVNTTWDGVDLTNADNNPSNYNVVNNFIDRDTFPTDHGFPGTDIQNAYKESHVIYFCVRFFNENDEPLLTIWQPNYNENIIYKNEPVYPYDLVLYDDPDFNNGQFIDHYDLRHWDESRSSYYSEVQRTWGQSIRNVTATTYGITDIYKYIANYDVFQAIHDNMLSSLIPGEIYDFFNRKDE